MIGALRRHVFTPDQSAGPATHGGGLHTGSNHHTAFAMAAVNGAPWFIYLSPPEAVIADNPLVDVQASALAPGQGLVHLSRSSASASLKIRSQSLVLAMWN